MKERPIIFRGEMIKAILAGHKTQTRRVIKPQLNLLWPINCPHGGVGDKLWVRETWGIDPNELYEGNPARKEYVVYKADDYWNNNQFHWGWTPSIFMPRWASRITLEIERIRVERLQNITEADAFAEGVSGGDWLGDPVGEFAKLWNSINEKRGFGWETNCWCWVLEFKRLENAQAY